VESFRSDQEAVVAGRLPPPEYFLARPDRLIAFDFDGTLVPTVPRPEDAVLPESVRHALIRVAGVHRLVICSGRAVRDLAALLPQVPNLDLIGNHGGEWLLRRGGAELNRDFTPPEWRAARDRLARELSQAVAERGGSLEDKGASLTLHFRHSGSSAWSAPGARAWLEERVGKAARVLGGKAAWNILPENSSKGISLIRYAQEEGFRELIYFGDEPTDETVFERPELPIWGVKVGPGATAARYRARDVDQVRGWLASLVIHIG
jgi:trehalose 6-phosphate phosphatase